MAPFRSIADGDGEIDAARSGRRESAGFLSLDVEWSSDSCTTVDHEWLTGSKLSTRIRHTADHDEPASASHASADEASITDRTFFHSVRGQTLGAVEDRWKGLSDGTTTSEPRAAAA